MSTQTSLRATDSTPEATRLRSRLPRVAGHAVDRARLTVVPRLRSRAPRVPFVALVSVVLLAGVVGLLLFNTSMQQASFEATRLESQARTLAAQEQSLTMQLDKLRDPQRLAVRAQSQGLVPPSAVAFIDVETGKVTGTPTPATAEDGLRLKPPPPRRPPGLDPTPITQQAPTQQAPTQQGQQAPTQQGQQGQQAPTQQGQPGAEGER